MKTCQALQYKTKQIFHFDIIHLVVNFVVSFMAEDGIAAYVTAIGVTITWATVSFSLCGKGHILSHLTDVNLDGALRMHLYV